MLAADSLSFRYDKKKLALDNITLDLSKGNIIGLIGGNGSGKSTLFMNLLGLLRPCEGKVLFHNEPLKYNKKSLLELRKQAAIVFQNPDMQIFYSNVYDDVAFALRNLKIEEAEVARRVSKALSLVGATDFADKPIQYLSYGQKKRVAIAGALVLDSEWLLLDEPTAGLDPDGRTKMIEIIENLAQQGKKVLISSHDIDLIYQISEYIYILKQGKLLAEGKDHEIFNNTELIDDAQLTQPWLVKLHVKLGYPLFKTEQELFDYCEMRR